MKLTSGALAEAMAAADAAIRAADAELLASAEQEVDVSPSPLTTKSAPAVAVAVAAQPPSPISTTIQSSSTSGSPWSDGRSSSYDDDRKECSFSSSDQSHQSIRNHSEKILQLKQMAEEERSNSSKVVDGIEGLSPIKRYQNSPDNSLFTETSFDTAYSSLGQIDTPNNAATAVIAEVEKFAPIQPELSVESKSSSLFTNNIPAAEHLPDPIKEKKKSVFAQWEQKAVQNNNNNIALIPLNSLPVVAPVKRWTPPNKKIENFPPPAPTVATTVKRQWPPPKMNETVTSIPATELSVEELEKLLAKKKAAATTTIKRWTPPSKKVDNSNAVAQSGVVNADVIAPFKRWIPPAKKMEEVVVADVVASAVKKWTPSSKKIETVDVTSEKTEDQKHVVADVIAPVVKKWTPPTKKIETADRVTNERTTTATAVVDATSAIAPVLKRWSPPGVHPTGEQTSTSAASAVSPNVVAPVIKRWTPPAKTSIMAEMTDELASVLRRRQDQDKMTDLVATEVKKPVYTGKIWSPVEMEKQAYTSTQPTSPESDGGSSASDHSPRQLTYQVEIPAPPTPLLPAPLSTAKPATWNPFKKLFSSKSKADSPTSIMEVDNGLKPDIEFHQTMNQPLRAETSSTIVGHAGEVGQVNLDRAFDDIESSIKVQIENNDIVLEGGEQVTKVASSAVVDPVIKRWVPPETKVGVAQMSVVMLSDEDDTAIWSTVGKTYEAKNDGPLSQTMSSPPEPTQPSSTKPGVEILVPPLSFDNDNKEINKVGAAVKEDEKEEEVSAINKDDPSKMNDNTAFGQVDPPADENETPIHLLPRDVFGRVIINAEPSRERSNVASDVFGRVIICAEPAIESSNVSANASMGAVVKNDSPFKSYVEKQKVWQRKRQERQMNVAKSGIYRSGSTNYYGLQPQDNEHCYDKVLSEMETIKKSEELKQKDEMAREQQEFHAIVTTLVEEVMPSEVDQVDELIEEYEGREADLIQILQSMRPAPQDIIFEMIDDNLSVDIERVLLDLSRENNNNDDDDSYRSIDTGMSLLVPRKNSDVCDEQDDVVESGLDEDFKVGLSILNESGLDKENGPIIFNGDGIMRTPDVIVGTDHKNWRLKSKGRRILIAIIVLFFIAVGTFIGVAAWLGIFPFDGSLSFQRAWPFFVFDRSKYGGFVPRGDDDDLIHDDENIAVWSKPPSNFDVQEVSSVACQEKIQKFGINNLQGNYPKVAIDGNQAVVASGSGYVTFFSLDSETKIWSQTEVFGLTSNVGEIRAVAISGNTAVVGAPMASMSDLELQEGLVQTGAIFIYERDSTSATWQQMKGQYSPNEYINATEAVVLDQYADAHFGTSIDIDGDVIVVGAPDESSDRGSVTIFIKDEETKEWNQIDRLYPDLCGDEYFGHATQVKCNDDRSCYIAVSADCDINIVMYKMDRRVLETGEDEVQISRIQEFQQVDPQFGTISSISMSHNQLAYSTVAGGLFFYDQKDVEFVLSQKNLELEFKPKSNQDGHLFEYPLSIDASTNMMTLTVANKIYVYFLGSNQEWSRKSFVLESQGDYSGYKAASVAHSGGHVLVAQTSEIYAYDFTRCILESAVETIRDAIPSPAPQTDIPVGLATKNLDDSILSGDSELADLSGAVCNMIDVIVNLDKNATSIYWEIVRAPGTPFSITVAESPKYDVSLKLSAQTQSLCLVDGFYEFTIYDYDDDGEDIASDEWSQIMAFYQILHDGVQIVSGSSFGSVETKNFTLSGSEEPVRK